MDDARSAWREVCMVEYRITGDMDKATRFADSVEQRFRAATLREAEIDKLTTEVRAATLREAADYADRKADKYEDYSAVAEQAAYGIADGLRDMAEEEK